MASRVFLWIEDRKGKAGYVFWDNLAKHLFPGVCVESKENNSELVKAVKSIKNSDNVYVIVFDNSFDNQQAVMEQKRLKQYADGKNNVFLMDIICFEYILLEFDNLIKWIYAPDDELQKKRTDAIAARKRLVDTISAGEVNYKEMREIVEYDNRISEYNVEQLAAKLLFELTRNTGFEVSKGNIGACWIKSCCEWKAREENDICGLDYDRLSDYDKMKRIYEGTSLKEQFLKVGLEASF